jgi:hypothetical protein
VGKGSVRRPPQISPAEEAKRWEEVFGKPEGELWESYKNRPGSAAWFTWGEWLEFHKPRKRCPDTLRSMHRDLADY